MPGGRWPGSAASARLSEDELVFDLVAELLELKSARQIEALQIVGRIQVEAEQRIVDDLDARLGHGRCAQVRCEALRAKVRLDRQWWREQQRVRAGPGVGRRDDHDRLPVARGDRSV